MTCMTGLPPHASHQSPGPSSKGDSYCDLCQELGAHPLQCDPKLSKQDNKNRRQRWTGSRGHVQTRLFRWPHAPRQLIPLLWASSCSPAITGGKGGTTGQYYFNQLPGRAVSFLENTCEYKLSGAFKMEEVHLWEPLTGASPGLGPQVGAEPSPGAPQSWTGGSSKRSGQAGGPETNTTGCWQVVLDWAHSLASHFTEMRWAGQGMKSLWGTIRAGTKETGGNMGLEK